MAPPYYILGPAAAGHSKDYPPSPVIRKAPSKLHGLLENFSLEVLNAINPCLAIIFKDTTSNTTDISTLHKAYTYDPVTTIKLIFLRGFGEFGNGFIEAALWLHQHHPFTLACNLDAFYGFGRFKDLLDILSRVLQGSIANEEEKKRVEIKNKRRGRFFEGKGREVVKEENGNKGNQLISRRAKDIARAKAGLEAYHNDWRYKYLHDRVSDFFAEILKSDLLFMEGGELEKISMAAKFCPSIDSSYDKATLICESIAKKVFSRDVYADYKDIEEAHYAYRVRNRLQKEVLVPLRKALEESKVTNQDSVRRQDSNFVAMEAYAKLAVEPDEKKKFKQYLKIVDKYGKWTDDDGTVLLPHQVFILMMNKRYEIAELYWQRLVELFSKNEKLKSCIAVCDISEGMSGTIVEEFCVSMGLLISESSYCPWKGKIFTFSDYPKLCKINGDNLRSKSEFIRELDSGEGLSFLKLYDRILQIVMTERLSTDRMVKKIFVFTNQNFSDSTREKWVADYREAWKSYRKRGYKTVPEIVFWNPKDCKPSHEVIGSPVDHHHRGIAVVKGFSGNLVSMFLMGDFHSTNAYTQQEENLTEKSLVPEIEEFLSSAISRDEFKDLTVMD